MIAITKDDICFATTACAEALNTDGVKRDSLDLNEVRNSLDFNIIKKPSFDEKGRQIPGQYHLVREDNNLFIPSVGVGKNFHPIQHLSVFNYIINDILPKVPNMSIEAAGTLHGCGTGIVMANIGDEYYIHGDDSPNHMRLLFSNPCNGYGSLVLGFTNVRLWCQNQIPAAVRQAKKDGFQIRHTINAELYVGTALEIIKNSIISACEIRRKSEGLARVKVNSAFIQKVIETIYPLKIETEEGTIGYTKTMNRRNEVMEQFESGATAQTIQGDTAWKLFNSFTYPIYNPTSSRKNIDAAEVFYTGTIGSRAEKTAKIFDTIHRESMKFAA